MVIASHMVVQINRASNRASAHMSGQSDLPPGWLGARSACLPACRVSIAQSGGVLPDCALNCTATITRHPHLQVPVILPALQATHIDSHGLCIHHAGLLETSLKCGSLRMLSIACQLSLCFYQHTMALHPAQTFQSLSPATKQGLCRLRRHVVALLSGAAQHQLVLRVSIFSLALHSTSTLVHNTTALSAMHLLLAANHPFSISANSGRPCKSSCPTMGCLPCTNCNGLIKHRRIQGCPAAA